MQITKITNNMNFGLTKSDRYKQIEQDLINSLKSPQRRKQAEIIAARIAQEVPNGELEIATSMDGDIFMLRRRNDYEVSYCEVGKVNKKKPLDTLKNLDKELQKYNPKF